MDQGKDNISTTIGDGLEDPQLHKFKNFTPRRPARFQGFHFKSAQHMIGRIGHQAFFGLQVFGCACLAVSGVIDGQWGRAETGAGNLSKNLLGLANEKNIGPFKNLNPETGRYVFMGLGVASNLPLFIAAMTVPGVTAFEIAASVCVVTAYAMLTAPGVVKLCKYSKNKAKDIAKNIAQNNQFFKGKAVQSTSRPAGLNLLRDKTPSKLSKRMKHFNEKAANATQEWIAPSLLGVRAVARFADGIVRGDIAATMAGAAFILAIPTIALGNWYERHMKQSHDTDDKLNIQSPQIQKKQQQRQQEQDPHPILNRHTPLPAT